MFENGYNKIKKEGETAMNNLMMFKLWMQAKFDELFRDERGEVNIVAIVILIGIAVILALVFKDAISNLITTLVNHIQGNAENALDI